MTTPQNPDANKLARWQTLWHKLHAVRFDPLPNDAEIDQLLAVLPKRRAEESLTDWLRRCSQGTKRILTPVAAFERWAASGAAEAMPSLPEAPMLSLEENFRLTVTPDDDGTLRVLVEALGLAAFEYAGCEVALALGDWDGLLAEFQLDEDGKGEAHVEDNAMVRQALVQPVLVKIEDADEQ